MFNAQKDKAISRLKYYYSVQYSLVFFISLLLLLICLFAANSVSKLRATYFVKKIKILVYAVSVTLHGHDVSLHKEHIHDNTGVI